VRQLIRAVLGTTDAPDRDLLARFVAARDEDAFAEIVRRHGPMVLAVCRRVTGRAHDADDAFQAAFMVLARRAAHLTKPELLANWLYGVAYRTALEARTARRRAEEHAVPHAPEPAAPQQPDDTADLRRAIDEELARLPDKYRAAVVLCELEGASRAAAARQLGIPEGTLSSRLAHARKVLAERLSKRGITASATGLFAALGGTGTAHVPTTLAVTTVTAAVAFAPGAPVPLGAATAAFTLATGVLKTMFASRLRLSVAALALALAGTGGAVAYQYPAPPPVQPNVPLVPGTLPPADRFDPVAFAQPPAPKKVAAKGIEDDDVPYTSFPSQAVVRIEDGKLIVRQRAHYYEPVTEKVGNQTATSYQIKSGVSAQSHDPADVAVFDMKGNRVAPKTWKETLKSDVHVLVSADGKLPNPRELALFKQDTLVIVLPSAVVLPGNGPRYSAPLALPAVAPTQPALPRPNTWPALPPAPAAPPAPPAFDVELELPSSPLPTVAK
jgi:RNA polymerase sigma factor (sigma-70 family)